METRDNGSLLRSHAELGDAARRPQLPVLRRPAAGARSGRRWTSTGSPSTCPWDPSGVAVVITPWNAPLMLATWRIAPALAAGNTVVVKPPEWAPLTASLLADIAHDAGLPDGAFNVVQGIGEEAGAALVANPGVDRIAFTGSVPTGRLVAAAAGAEPDAGLARARREVAVRGVRRRRPGRAREASGRSVRQRGTGLPGRHPPAGRVRDLRRVPGPLRRGASAIRAGRSARRRDRHRAAHHARALRTRRRVRSGRATADGAKRSSVAARTKTSVASTTGPPCSSMSRPARGC